MKSTRYGFCLADLLLTIAIIAILAAILFPVFARSREAARATSCMNNLINISLALRTYANDNDMLYPPADNDLSPLLPVYTSQRSFGCPSTAGATFYRFGTIPGAVRKEKPKAEKAAAPAPAELTPEAGMPAQPQPDPAESYKVASSEPGTSYFYVSGYRHDMLMHRMPIAGDMEFPHNDGTGNVLYTDGSVRRIGVDEYRRAGLARYAWTEEGKG